MSAPRPRLKRKGTPVGYRHVALHLGLLEPEHLKRLGPHYGHFLRLVRYRKRLDGTVGAPDGRVDLTPADLAAILGLESGPERDGKGRTKAERRAERIVAALVAIANPDPQGEPWPPYLTRSKGAGGRGVTLRVCSPWNALALVYLGKGKDAPMPAVIPEPSSMGGGDSSAVTGPAFGDRWPRSGGEPAPELRGAFPEKAGSDEPGDPSADSQNRAFPQSPLSPLRLESETLEEEQKNTTTNSGASSHSAGAREAVARLVVGSFAPHPTTQKPHELETQGRGEADTQPRQESGTATENPEDAAAEAETRARLAGLCARASAITHRHEQARRAWDHEHPQPRRHEWPEPNVRYVRALGKSALPEPALAELKALLAFTNPAEVGPAAAEALAPGRVAMLEIRKAGEPDPLELAAEVFADICRAAGVAPDAIRERKHDHERGARAAEQEHATWARDRAAAFDAIEAPDALGLAEIQAEADPLRSKLTALEAERAREREAEAERRAAELAAERRAQAAAAHELARQEQLAGLPAGVRANLEAVRGRFADVPADERNAIEADTVRGFLAGEIRKPGAYMRRGLERVQAERAAARATDRLEAQRAQERIREAGRPADPRVAGLVAAVAGAKAAPALVRAKDRGRPGRGLTH